MTGLATDIRERNGLLKQERAPLDALWREISHWIRPLLGQFDNVTGGEWEKHGPRNRHLIESTASRFVRLLKSGLLAGASSQAEQWFQREIIDGSVSHAGRVWLQEDDRAQRTFLSQTNVYRVVPMVYEESALFGTGAAVVLDDDLDRPFGLYPLTVGQYCLSADHYGEVDTLYREFSMTARQLRDQFGEDVLSKKVRDYLRNKRPDTAVGVIHAMEPDGHGQWRSVYVETDGEGEQVLRNSTHPLPPFVVHQWEPVPQSPYGRGLGVEALPHVIALREMLLMYGKAAALEGDPPTYGPPGSGDIDKTPGAHNELAVPGEIRAIFEFRGDGRKLKETIEETKQEIAAIFYADLILLVSSRDPETAREVAELSAERVLALGPVLEQVHTFLRPLLDLVFHSRQKRRLVKPPPTELILRPYDTTFTSSLAQAMRVRSAEAIVRAVRFMAEVAAIDQRAVSVLDSQGAIRSFVDATGAPTKMTASEEQVAAEQDSANQVQSQRALLEDVGQLAGATRDVAAAR